MPSPPAPILDRRAFRAWLQSKAPHSYVGQRGQCSTCPLAQFLTETTGRACWVSGVRYGFAPYEPAASANNTVLPKWAMEFVFQIEQSGEGLSRVRAATALRILGAIPEDADA